MTFPNVFFGLGGAGKEILFTMFNQEWLLKKIIGDRIAGKLDNKIYVTIIDTATDEYPDDLENKNIIEEKIKKILNELESYLASTDIIEIDVICIPEKININRMSDLIAYDVSKKVKNSSIIKSIFNIDKVIWWLEDPEEGLEGWFNTLKNYIDPSIEPEFTRGVFRKRAISKALFYRLLSEGRFFESSPDKVAIFVGLGGGTGSGIFIDLATYIYKKYQGVPIDLFAVLPTKEELDDEKANAFAALSELEYLRLNGQRIFQSVILLPFDPTGWVVSKAQALKEKVREFDKIVSYIAYNFYEAGGVGGADLFNRMAPLKYSQYLLATGTIIKYEIENLFEIKKLASLSVESLERFTDLRSNINKILNLTLEEFRELFGTSEKIPPKKDYDYLYSLVEKLELWNYKAFEILKYSAIEEIKSTILYMIESSELSNTNLKGNFDSLKEYINVCEKVLDTITRKPEFQPKDEMDRLLPEVLFKAFKETNQIVKMLQLYNDLNIDERVRAILEKLIKNEFPTPAEEAEFEKYFSSLTNELSDLLQKYEKLKANKNELETEKSSISEQVSDFILSLDKELNSMWEFEEIRKLAFKEVEKLNTIINKFIIEIKSDMQNKKHEEKYVKNENEWLNKIEFSNVENSLREIFLNMNLEKFGIKSENELVEVLRKIMLAIYYYNMKDFYTYKMDKSRFRKKKYKEWMRTFENKFAEMIESLRKSEFLVYYDKNGLPESIDITNHINDEIANKLKSICDEIGERIERKFNIEVISKLNKILDSSSSRTELKDKIQREIFEEILNKNKIIENIEKLEEELSNMEKKINQKRKVHETMKSFKERYLSSKNEVNEALKWFNRFIEYVRKTNEKIEERDIWGKSSQTYISKIPPDSSMVGAIGDSIENLTLDEILNTDKVSKLVVDGEIKKILSRCKSIVERISSDNTYNGIGLPFVEFQHSDNKGIGRWSPRIVFLCVNDGKSIIKAVDTIETSLRDLVNTGLTLVDKNEIKLFPNSEASGPFDVAILLYIGPVFLEHINNVGGDRGYKKHYDRKKERIIGDKKIPNILHHSLMLEKGVIVRRSDLIDLKKAAELAWREFEETEDVSKDVLNYFEILNIRG